MSKSNRESSSETRVNLDSAEDCWIIENKHLCVKIRASNGCFDVTDKVTGVEWSHDPWVDACAELLVRYDSRSEVCNLSLSRYVFVDKVEQPCKGVQITLQVPVTTLGQPIEAIILKLQILVPDNSPDLNVRVIEIKNESPEYKVEALRFPIRQFYLRSHYDDGCLVIPEGRGYIVPSKLKPKEDSKLAPFTVLTYRNFFHETVYPTMSWFGATKGNSALAAVIDTPDDFCLDVIGNEVPEHGGHTRISAASVTWLMSLGKLGYERSVTYHFIPNGGYVDMAKYFRKHLMQKGLFKSLKEKIRENTNAQKMIGAPWIFLRIMTNRPFKPEFRTQYGAFYDGSRDLHYSFKDVQKFIEDLHDMGIDRAHLMITGWQRRGFDNLHPDIWPPNVEAGGTKELAKASELADKYGYVFGLWDNYMDIYRDAPSYSDDLVMKGADSALLRGGFWCGGQAWWLCPKPALDLVKRNIPTAIKSIKPQSIHVDVETAHPFHECYDPKHPLTRSDDREYRTRLLSYLNDNGLLTISENGWDWAVPYVIAFGLGSHGRHGIPTPLFELVFHDAVIRYGRADSSGTRPRPNTDLRQYYGECALNSLLRGDTLDLWFYGPMSEDDKTMVKELYHLVSRLHREIGLEEMVDHEFLTSNFTVQKTTFSSGTEIIVNFGMKSYELEEGRTIPPYGFQISGPKINLSGKFKSSLDIT